VSSLSFPFHPRVYVFSGKRCLVEAMCNVPVKWERGPLPTYLIGSGDDDTGVKTSFFCEGLRLQLVPDPLCPRGSWGSSVHGAQALQGTEFVLWCVGMDAAHSELDWWKRNLEASMLILLFSCF
jgi:hypothetical protein